MTKKTKRIVTVDDRMQKNDRYELSAPQGRGFDPGDVTCRRRRRQALLHWATANFDEAAPSDEPPIRRLGRSVQ